MPIVVFDFDHTLTTCDSTAEFFKWRLRQSWWRTLILLLLAPIWLLLWTNKITRNWPIHFAVWLASWRTSDQKFLTLQQQFVTHISQANSGSMTSFLLHDAKQALQNHQTLGHTVIIATGAITSLVELMLIAESITNVIVVGSTLKRRWGGLIADQHCLGPNKLRMLSTAGFKPPYVCVYSDHSADYPLFKHADLAVLVNAKAKCVSKLQVLLSDTLRLQSWR
jgi:phosphatidylglycerophosphatase C